MLPRRAVRQVALTAALLVLVVVLGFLQYRWLGQVSEAERAELAASLERRGSDLAEDFDREIATLEHLVRTATRDFGDAPGPGLSEAVDAWRRTARYPEMIEAVYVGDRDTLVPTLQRYDEARRELVQADWPDEWPDALSATVLRAATGDVTRGPQALREIVTVQSPLVITDPLLYVVWLPRRIALDPAGDDRVRGTFTSADAQPRQFVAIALDRAVVLAEMLPALTERHFTGDAIQLGSPTPTRAPSSRTASNRATRSNRRRLTSSSRSSS